MFFRMGREVLRAAALLARRGFATEGGKRLIGQRAIVTGASKGIGEAIALGYAREGANVVITYASDEKAAQQVVKKIEGLGSQAKAVKFDLLVPEDAEALVKQSVEFMGGVDILVNNAVVIGPGLARPLQNITEEDFQNDIVGNLIGPMRVAQKVCKQMIDQQLGGSILNILSAAFTMPVGDTMSQPYEAAKAGLAMFTKSLAVGMGRYGIRVNAIAPGKTDTGEKSDKKAQAARDEVSKLIIAKTPLGRVGKPSDYQEMAISLVLSKYITGQAIIIDGGVTCGSVLPLKQHAILEKEQPENEIEIKTTPKI